MKIVGIIPARFKSTRFEGKPLADLCGKTVIQRVYEAASRSKLLGGVVVATDDRRIFDCVKGFGGNVLMTGSRHKSGTDRIIEAAKKIKADIVVNVQGDEPFINPSVIDSVAAPFLKEKELCVTTAAVRMEDESEIADPNNVKVVCDKDGYALYFSRSMIPFLRDKEARRQAKYFKHLGIYGYRKVFLEKFAALPHSMLEETEKLEQLRVLEAGYKIKVVLTKHSSIGIDTKEDLKKARALFENRRKT